MDASRHSWPGALLVEKERTGSTMDDALALGLAGCPSGSVVTAAFQDSGRGRVPGRTWLSPAGESLLATVVLRAPELAFPLHEIPLRAGVALAAAVEGQTGLAVRIKWPNDIMVGGRKLCGLLCELHGPIALVGFGINCNQASFPPEIAGSACSLLQATGRRFTPRDLLPPVLDELRRWVSPADWLTPLRERLYRRGETVRVDILGAARSIEGVLLDIEGSGGLLVRLPDGRVERVLQGEISPDP